MPTQPKHPPMLLNRSELPKFLNFLDTLGVKHNSGHNKGEAAQVLTPHGWRPINATDDGVLAVDPKIRPYYSVFRRGARRNGCDQ